MTESDAGGPRDIGEPDRARGGAGEQDRQAGGDSAGHDDQPCRAARPA